MSFWGELKRRNVYRVGVAYAIVAWLLIQATAIIFPAQHLPAWTVTFVIALLIIGFPVAILLAWAYEVTPEGIRKTKEIPLSESITHLTGRKLNYIVIGLLILAVVYILFDNYYLDSPGKALTELRSLYANDSNLSSGNFFEISILAAYFGDSELAMDGVEKGFSIDGTGMFFVWLPVMKEVRQTPRFKKFVKKIGLFDYWNEFGWPDICHKLDNADFECD